MSDSSSSPPPSPSQSSELKDSDMVAENFSKDPWRPFIYLFWLLLFAALVFWLMSFSNSSPQPPSEPVPISS